MAGVLWVSDSWEDQLKKLIVLLLAALTSAGASTAAAENDARIVGVVVSSAGHTGIGVESLRRWFQGAPRARRDGQALQAAARNA